MVCDAADQFRTATDVAVLILILLEYGLRLVINHTLNRKISLNPYSIGIWSATAHRSGCGKVGELS